MKAPTPNSPNPPMMHIMTPIIRFALLLVLAPCLRRATAPAIVPRKANAVSMKTYKISTFNNPPVFSVIVMLGKCCLFCLAAHLWRKGLGVIVSDKNKKSGRCPIIVTPATDFFIPGYSRINIYPSPLDQLIIHPLSLSLRRRALTVFLITPLSPPIGAFQTFS